MKSSAHTLPYSVKVTKRSLLARFEDDRSGLFLKLRRHAAHERGGGRRRPSAHNLPLLDFQSLLARTPIGCIQATPPRDTDQPDDNTSACCNTV